MDATDQEQERRRARLRGWLQTHGGHAEVVRARGLTPGQASFVSQVVNGYSFGSRAARSMEARLGMPQFWLEAKEQEVTTPLSRGQAHKLSDIQATIDPITIAWGSVVSTELPERFQVRAQDRAMECIETRGLRPGDFAIFTTARPPEPGDVVLIADRDGNAYIRRYLERRPGHWQGVATNPSFQPLDSVADGLRILAVQCGHTWG